MTVRNQLNGFWALARGEFVADGVGFPTLMASLKVRGGEYGE